MDDKSIVDLYWARSENAIHETSIKYGKYCYAIAFNILNDSEDAAEMLNDTYMGAWNSMPPNRPAILSTFLGKLHGAFRLTGGMSSTHRNAEMARCRWR